MEYRTADALCGVYKITNIVNWKVYIGQSINLINRWKDHIHALNRNDSNCTLLQRAWNKYGQKSFSFEILELCAEEQLDEIEIKYIEIYDALNPDKGYNIEPGGNKNKHLSEETKQRLRESHLGRRHTEEAKRKMSESRTGEGNGMYGRHHTEEAKKKMSEAKKGKPGHPCSDYAKERASQANLGKIVSEETRKKLSESHKGRPAHNKIMMPVYCIELDKVFECPSDAAKELGIKNAANIMDCCKHIRKTCGGYHWEFAYVIYPDLYPAIPLTTQN